jgi:hypothetical protein
MERVTNHRAYSDLYFELKEKREAIGVYLAEKRKQFDDVGTFHLVDPDDYWQKLQEQLHIDNQLKELEKKVFN